jgi:hypothetical protein
MSNPTRDASLAHFKDGSNDLLVTPVAAAGWVGPNNDNISSDRWRDATIFALGTSIIFGIFTLALIPLVAQYTGDAESIYEVPVTTNVFTVRLTLYLTEVCRPQHVAFMAGIICFCLGTTGNRRIAVIVFGLAVALALASRPKGGSPLWTRRRRAAEIHRADTRWLAEVVMINPVRRVHYFQSQVLRSEDFEADQNYHREMRYLHNRLSGYGIASGLTVSPVGKSSVLVSPGVAIDIQGREIVLAEEVHLDLSTMPDDLAVGDVNLRWDQVPDEYIVAFPLEDPAEAFTRWLERPGVSLDPTEHADEGVLTLARVSRRGSQAVSIDLSVRRELRFQMNPKQGLFSRASAWMLSLLKPRSGGSNGSA